MSLLKTAFAALGKVQREQLLEAHLRDRVARVLGVSVAEVDAQRPLGSLGLDSLKAVELQHGLERELSITLPMADVLSARHVADLVSGVLEKMIPGAPSSSKTQPGAPPAPAADTSRLSRGQEALWFLQQLSPDSAAYNIAYAMRVRSAVDSSKLRRTLQVLVDRHACLRTRFENRNGRPWADVRERDEVSFTEVDAAGWTDARLQQYLTEQSHRPFDLARGPLFTVHLLTRSARDHVLLICVHHIAVDFWSLVVLTDEMGRLYGAEDLQSEARQLPPPVPYAEFVRWQDGMLGSDVGREHETYWLKQLSGTLPVLNLPTDRPRPPVQTYRGASHTFQLGPELTRALHDLARQQQVTLYSLLLATFQSLLHRYTGDADVLVGSPVAGRSREGFSGVVGYFVNMVALRGDLSDDPTFTELLSRTRATVLGALAHQDFPFALLVDRLEQNRDPSRSPVFQAAFVLEKPHILEELAEFVLGESGATMSLGGLQLESLALEQRVAQFDLTLMMVEAGGGLAASIQYNADLFDPSTIARLARHYQTLVEGVAARPQHRVSELPLLPVEEHRQLLEWKGEVEDVSPAVTLQGLFENQVARTPDAASVAWDGGQLSYRELNRRANQLAHDLRRRGVGPEILVGVCMDRSPEMIVAILGILKAGGGYFPLDPGYPRDRLSFMLRDGGVRLVLGKDRLAANLPPGQAQFVAVDAGWTEASGESGENPVPLATGQSLAYVMYTSGSTGTPNGVAVCQQSVIRLVDDPNYVTLTAGDVVLQLAPHTFDAATFEIWASLLHGGRLVLATDEKPSLEQVSQMLAKHRVSTLWLTSGLFHQLVDHDIDAFGSVRQLLAGGDVLSVSHVRNVLTRFPSCRVINGYGPTENTTFTCCYPMQGDKAAPAVSVPIGRPITGTEVFVVDRHQHAVPVGVSGELLTGGTGLARGYLGRPSLTAERFVPSTLSEHGGARLYKTGDLVRYLESGAIEFLGRLDYQLKIRGFRVELGEIETALTSHPMVRGSVVVAQAGPTAKRLIAYLVAESDRTPSTSQLREYLAQRLPDYMVPAVFMTLDAFPLTANGKVDRRALPAPDQSRPELDSQFEAPRPGSEAQLAAIWSELLGVDRIGRHDNFFELGGHSLIGTQVVSRVRDIARVDVPLRHLFERPTVAGLAEWLDKAAADQQERRDPGLLPQAGDEPPVMSFTQERLWLLEQLILGTPVYNIPAVVRLKGALNVTALGQAIDEIRRRHEVLRTNFRTVDGQPVPVVSPASARIVPIADLSDLAHDANATAVRLLIRAEALRPFDLASDPLIRISLVRLGASEHVMLATMHHVVSDGWSIGILMRELASLYRAFCSGARSQLTEPAIQYRDFAHWQRRWLQGRTLDEQLTYWTNALSGARTSIELPIDRPRTSPPSYRGSTESRLLQPDLVTALHAFGSGRGLTPFMVILAALDILLARVSRQSDLVVGTVISGRTRTEIEPLIGCFMNFLPLRTTVARDASGETVLQQVRTTVLDADAHQECPFQKIVEAARPERSSSQNPLYNVSFQFDNYPQGHSFTDTLEASFETPHRQISQLDLRFVASETRDGTLLSCEYATDLFDPETVRGLLEALDAILGKLIQEPAASVGEFPVPESLLRRAQPETVAIAATFTAEPVEESIAFWTDHLDVPCTTQFAPFGQVFQQLLAPDSLLAANRRGLNVVLVRFEDWQSSNLQREVEELGRAVTMAAERIATPWLVCICPSSPATLSDPAQQALHERMEDLLASRLQDTNGVALFRTGDLARAYPVPEYYDRHGDEIGRVPYTRAFFAALGTAIVRHIAAIKRSPYKVIVLDCDQTLWRGVVGEDGVDGIAIGSAHKALQEFMVAQHDAGKLICLCSKNQESDVLEVFDRRDDMVLRRDHLVSWRINWQAKSQNIRSLADELQLGLDSFVFLDDSPVECAEVRANCPDVLSLQVPTAAGQLPAFLRSVWAFDNSRTTSEDRQRTRLYQQNAERERLREKSLTFADFMADLDLQVTIDPMSPPQLSRVSQLTQRTNQFNVHKVGRSEVELDALSREANTHCLTVGVSDRFGDYGLVGVAICESDTDQLTVDTLLLSCRALGRGVEHRVLARLGEIAADRGLAHVRIPLKPTDRNQPALEFLTSVGARYSQPNGEGIDFVIPTQEARAVTFQPGTAAEATPEETTTERAAPAARAGWSAARLSEISARLLDVPTILGAIDDRKRGRVRPDARAELVAPRTETERLIAGVWEQLLGLDRVGIHENFFELGGHSLLATQVIARLCEVFRVDLRLQDAFDAPTVAALAQIVERAKEADGRPRMPPVRRTEREGELSLSFAQERLWFLDQLEPASDAYNVPAAMRVLGSLSIGALEQTIEDILRRHEVLRTTFSTAVPPVLQIHQPSPFALPVVDLTCTPDCEAVCRRLAVEEAKRPFDLARGPLFRMTVVALSAREHVLLLTMHHVISDGWSIGILVDELSTGYGKRSSGIPFVLSDLPVQYADFAVWQRNWLSGAVLADQIEYWKSQLSGAPPSLDLPTDRPRPPVQTFRGARQRVRVSGPITRALKSLNRRQGTTLFMTLLTAFQALIHRWTDQTDILVGVPIAGRQQAETQGLIGFFVNTLVMRGRVRPDAPFQELLAETRDVAMQAYAHQDLPFEKLVEGLGGERDLSRTPLFQVVFALQNAPFKPLDLAELRLEPFEVEQVTAKFELTLNLAESQDGIQGSLEYNTDLFDAATMERMAGHFETLLEGIVANPAQRVEELPLMSPPERQRLLVEWNATEAALPEHGLIHELVEAQAEKRPDAVAVAYQERLLGYRELNARANQLAGHLRKLGVGPEVPVGILMERSSAMVEGMLGVLKAGGTYLPLDPEAPSDRLQFMIADAGIRVVLTVESLESDLPAVAHVVCLDRDRRAISQQGKENLESRVDNGNLAYVIYTSGSTGRPKGVGVPHGGLRNLVAWHQKVFGLTPSSRATQIAAPTFDASVWEIWPYLAAGSSVHIPDDATRNSPADLALWLTTENVTHTFMPTPLAEEVLQEPWPLQTSLEFFLTGGDELRRVPKQALPFRLTNQYGPTENTVVTTWTPVESTRTVEKPPPIGRPIDNVRVYLLDRRLNAVPVGVNGELYIGGSSLSRGYASRADLTAERFVPDPFSTKPGARLYRSGDLCRFSPVGDLEFQGRIDYQVKIRGFRIELGEIEAVLGQFPGVRQAVVLARPDARGSARLVAYVVPHDGSPDVMALRSYLKASLPEYMVPTAFVTLDTLPLTSNGKVNRRALPAPQVSATEETYLAPRNHHEKRLADMFAEVLGMDRVGVHDNFFEIGGHSLLATKLVSRIRAAFDTRFPLRRVFESPTVFELAKSLTDEETPSRVTPGEELPLLERTRQEGPLPLSFAQQRLWFLDRMEPGNPYYNMPTALRVSGDLRVSALEQAIDEIIRRHEVLQNCYVLQQGQPRQVRMPRRDLTLPIVDLSSLQGASREEHERLLAAADARRPFDLATGPVVRAALLKKGEGSYTILFAMHHVVSDGWSVAIVVRELSALYEALGAGRPSPLPELPIQYADFAVWQRRWLESDGLKSQLSYWKARLGGHLPTLAIRTDRPRPEIESFRGADEILLIPQALAGALNRLSAREHVTLFMTLVAAYKTLLYRNVGQDDIVVGTDLAGRNQAELEGLIGFFVNLLVLRTDLSGNPTFRALLARVRETAMGAFAHQDVPFDRLVEELQPKRHRSRTPLFQMLFVMENIPMETLRLPGLTMTPMPNQADTARFDLALFVREQDGGLVTKWTYKTDLFDRGTIQRMANQYVALLEHIAAAPDTRVNELALQTQAEIRDQALEEQRRREARMSSLVPGRRRARKLPETPGGTETNRAGAEDDAAVGDASKQVRTR